MYESLRGIAGLATDEYGNLAIAGLEGDSRFDLKKRHHFILSIDPAELFGTTLSELLNWLRRGQGSMVNWYCSLPDLIEVIAVWRKGNPDAGREAFCPYEAYNDAWEEIWIHAWPGKRRRAEDFTNGSYPLCLHGRDGNNVAAAAYRQISQGGKLTVPPGFEHGTPSHQPTCGCEIFYGD